MHARYRLLACAAALAFSTSATIAFAQDSTPLSQITLQGEQPLAVGNLAYNPVDGTLLVGSLAGGQVLTVHQDGTLTPLIQDSAITSTRGLFVDSAANRLVVINTSGGFGAGQDPSQMQLPEGFDPSQLPQLPDGVDPSQLLAGQLPEGFDPSQLSLPEGVDASTMQAMMAAMNQSVTVLVYDLATGEQVLNVDLSDIAPDGGRLATGVTVDNAGNTYVTDGAAGVIYRVDPSGTAAFLSDSHFASDGIGLTGIVYHPDGILLVSKADGSLFSIPLSDPSAVQVVTIDDAPTAINGLALLDDGRLVILDEQAGSLHILTSSDGWATASVSSTTSAPDGTSSITSDGETVYLLQSFGIGAMALAGQAGSDASVDIPAPTITQLGV